MDLGVPQLLRKSRNVLGFPQFVICGDRAQFIASPSVPPSAIPDVPLASRRDTRHDRSWAPRNFVTPPRDGVVPQAANVSDALSHLEVPIALKP
jgi:hypothetical protein